MIIGNVPENILFFYLIFSRIGNRQILIVKYSYFDIYNHKTITYMTDFKLVTIWVAYIVLIVNLGFAELGCSLCYPSTNFNLLRCI